MEVVLIILGLVIVWYLRQNAKAKALVRQHSYTLSARTGIPAAAIEKQMIDQRLTPGEWAVRHGLDAMTFEPLGVPRAHPTTTSGGHLPSRGESVVPERELPDPDWEWIREQMEDGERQLDAAKGWSIGNDVDHPCTVYLTNAAVYVHVRPDTLAPPRTVRIPLPTIRKCGVGQSDMGLPRLVIVHDPEGTGNPEQISGVGVDLCATITGQPGAAFGRRVETAVKGFGWTS